MPRLFTVRWPRFARLEAILFFPVAMLLAIRIGPVRALVENGLLPLLSPLHVHLGVAYAQIIWFATGLAIFAPYTVGLIVADRILTVRKGYALLSIVMIVLAAAAGVHLSTPFIDYLPASLTADGEWFTPEQRVGLIAAGFAFLLHAWPLWTGLRDDGDVAARLIAAEEEYRYGSDRIYRSGGSKDVYYRQTAEFREWLPKQALDRAQPGPRAHSGLKMFTLVTWIVLVIGVGTAYHNWSRSGAKDQPAAAAPAAPVVPAIVAPASLPVFARSGVAPAVAAPMPLAPVPSLHAQQRDLPNVIAIPPLPTVQRPSDVSANIQGANGYAGPNEAVAQRGGDGGFAFDAVVNGTHVPMLFDTGASVVAIREEDASRLGIALGRLTYSAKVKTANGVADVAPVIIDTLTIGNITQRAVPGFVAKQGALHANLLGQSFLARLSGYNVDKNVLLLKGR